MGSYDVLGWTKEDWEEFNDDPIGDNKIGNFVSDVFREMQREIAERDDNDYEFNREQGLKLFAAYEFFESLVKKHGGRIEPINLKPREEVGYLTCYCLLYDLVGIEIPNFCMAILGASAVDISAMLDSTVCISMTFPDVFVRKKK